jgi:hypothetical protein
MGMEKYGVACKCVDGHPDMGGMTKLANGDVKCGTCGRVYAHLKLVDQINLQEKPLKALK